jgi:asparagine synthase (glutamine-hydrolysing)
MCGIVGLVNYPAPAAEREELILRMAATIRHRGPDDQGSYVDEHVALAMQRLSVVDLPGGHQPMATSDGALHVVFNGEIYNHHELRRQLQAEGVPFRTASDTEVILAHYQRYGLDAVHAFNGMFAFAIWDRRQCALHLVRDRMGVKPLYYYWDGRVFAFASEIKALFEVPGVVREVNPQAIWDYLTFRYVPGPQTIWKHIAKLPPAHRLTISVAAPQPVVTRWWDIPAPAGGESPVSHPVATFGRLLTDAVRLRMVADVPVGIMLSGGIDSSAVAAVAVQDHPRVKTFSVSFAGSPTTDERAYARQVAAHLGTDHAEVEIGQSEFLDFLPAFVRYTDEPLADLASVPLYYVCQLARQSVTVALSGEGADEILAGYDFDRWWASRQAAGGGEVRRDTVPPHMTNYLDSAAKRGLLCGGTDFPDSVDVLRGHLRRAGDRHPLDQMLFLYCQDWLVEDLLMKADRMSMANSLELRTPFLDYRLVEWAARAPLSAKLGKTADGRGQTKRVLREFAAPLLPPGIVTREKRGFPVPVYDWLADRLQPFAAGMILGAEARLNQWCRRQALQDLFALGTAAGAAPHDRHRLWHLIILEQWLREWQP